MQKIKKMLPVALMVIALAVPLIALAQFKVNNTEWTGNNAGLAKETDIGVVIVSLIRWITGIIGLICVIMIIYGGVTYATAAGNEDRIEMGKGILLWAIVGLVIVLLAFVFAQTIAGLFI